MMLSLKIESSPVLTIDFIPKMKKTRTIPRHIAIIMDGNGRWAKKRKLLRIVGHRKGVEVVKAVVNACSKRGVKFLTLYAFSTENWKRSKNEVSFLMRLLNRSLEKAIQNLKQNNIRFLTIGRVDGLPHKVLEIITKAKDATRNNTGLCLIIALNYGARMEIIDAALSLHNDIKTGKISPEEVNEGIFARYLYSADIPDPDLLIRTSGEMRLSNFLLWQLSYSELYVTEKLWPDFNEQDLECAIAEFQKRERRFGAV